MKVVYPQWPQERLDQLKALCDRVPVLSVDEIAAQMSSTHAAVLYHRRRLGLTRGRKNWSGSTQSDVACADQGHVGTGMDIIAYYDQLPHAMSVLWFGTWNEFECMRWLMDQNESVP